jgi:hypothetical protein
LAQAAETVRALKVRRLGNDLMALKRLALAHGTGVGTGVRSTLAMRRAAAQGDGAETDAEAARFADLLIDIALVRRALEARAGGATALDPALAEDLLGKTWREAELERVAGLELFPLAEDRVDDGEFKVETSYLLDLGDGAIYAEKQIAPLALRSASPKERRRLRLLVDEAGLYPGNSPRRIKLLRIHRAALRCEDVDRLLGRAVQEIPAVRTRLVERLRSPFDPAEAAVLFRPANLVRDGDRLGALDGVGRFMALGGEARVARELPSILPEPGRYALFGLLVPGDGPSDLTLRVHTVVGHLRWGSGPVWPDAAR